MGMSVGAATRQYVSGRAQRGEIAKETQASYREILGLFAAHVGRDRLVSEVTRNDVKAWIESAKVSPTTKRHRLSALRTFYEWAQVEGYARHDPTVGLKAPKTPRRVPRAIPQPIARRTVLACASARERVIVSLMLTDGLRAKEVAGLELADVDLGQQVLLVKAGKGGHERVVALADDAKKAIERYITERGRAAGPLILSEGNDPFAGIGPRRVVRIVSAIMHRAQAGDTGHSLRHSAARDFLDAGGDIRGLRDFLGHASLRATEVYTPFVSVTEMRPYVGSYRYLDDPESA